MFVCACKSIVRDSVVGREKFHLKFIGSEGFLKYNPDSRNNSFPFIGECLGKTVIHAYMRKLRRDMFPFLTVMCWFH